MAYPVPPKLSSVPFSNIRQFILWKLVPSKSQPGKFEKVPCNIHGLIVDAHTPANWLTASEALEAQHRGPFGVGFVFTIEDDYWFIDLDDAWTNGELNAQARKILDMFPGAAVEISYSGNGLHIFGRGRPPAHKSKATLDGQKIEFYSDVRFAALTGTQAAGNAQLDFTAALPQLIAYAGLHADPTAPSAPVAHDGPVLGYTGPVDNAALLTLIRDAKGSARAMMGDRAGAWDLFTGNAAVLAPIMPQPGRSDGCPFDRTRADGALMCHLAFWTGKHRSRMLELFRASALWREDQHTRNNGYILARSLDFAIATTQQIYDWVPSVPSVPTMPGVSAIPAIISELESNSLPPDETWFIDSLLPGDPGIVSMIAGQSSAGKSFYAVGLAVALASRVSFLDHACWEKMGVIYIAVEGAGTINKRIYAAKKELGITEQLPIAIIKKCLDLKNPINKSALIAEINRQSAAMVAAGLCDRVGVVILDTMTVAFSIMDENSNSEATQVGNIMHEIAESTQTVLVPIHHLGKDKTVGIRGASAYRGILDHCVAILGDRDEQTGEIAGRKVAIIKARDNEEGLICSFKLKIINLGMTKYFKPRTTCVFVRTEGDIHDHTGARNRKIRKNERYFHEAFEACVKSSGGKAHPLENVRAEFDRIFPDDRAGQRMVWKRIMEELPDIYNFRDGIIIRK